MTKTIADDVAAAKDEISIIKRMIAAGHFRTTAALISALQAEASAQGVLDSARQAAAQQAAAIAAAKKAAASTYSTPIDLQLAEARAQLTTATTDDIAAEKKILAAAKAAVAAGKKNKQGQLAALQIELQAQQALASLQQQSATTFTQSLRLQLALAKAQATGADITPILKREKAALLKALKAAKGNIQKQIDIYNQIAAINQQMQSSVTNAYGDYKKASVKALTANLALTAAQRRELEQRLSQRGPGGTVPATGVGAAGYIIGPDGRPIHRHRRPRHGGDSGGSGNGSGPSYHPTFIINVELDGEKITRKVTINQQRHRRRNPSSRRGPNAGSATS
jgi:protein-arginine kinase activator protein McsA